MLQAAFPTMRLPISGTRPGQELRGAKQIAHHFGVTDRTVRRWVKKGVLAVEKIGGRTSPIRLVGDVDKEAGK